MATKDGEPSNATFGFTSMLLDVLQREKPQYIAVAFDVGKTWRHERYPEYKGHRAKAPEEFPPQVERIKEVVRAFNIPIFTAKGWEADDVLGTLARQGEKEKVDVLIVTGDTDAHQLVTKRTKVLQSGGSSFGNSKLYDLAAVEKRYSLQPKQLIDYKAMVGDRSDNIPGVKGVGKKGATKLLQQYGSLQNIYEHLSELKGAQRKNLEKGRENAFLSQELVTIDTQVPDIELELEACRSRHFERRVVFELLRQLEFHTLIRRIPEPAPKKLVIPEPQQIESTYQLVDNEASLQALAEAISKADAVTLDTETDSVDSLTAKLVGLAVGLGAGTGYYLPIAHLLPSSRPPLIRSRANSGGEMSTHSPKSHQAPSPKSHQAAKGGQQLSFDLDSLAVALEEAEAPPNLPLERVRQVLNPLLKREGLKIYAHNAKFDVEVLLQHGFELPTAHHDTMIAAWLLNPGSSVGLKTLALTELGEEMTEISQLIGSGRKQIRIDQVEIAKVVPYACADVDMTSRLVPLQIEQLKEKKLYDLFHNIEMPLVRVLVDMEQRGVAFNAQALTDVHRQLTNRLEELEQQIYAHADYHFNINSTQQLSDVLFKRLKLNTKKSKKTKHRTYSTAVSVLEALRNDHPIIESILEQRTVQKLLSTYVEQLPTMVNPQTGRIHTNFSQTAASTGRLASSKPNLQNIPTRTELGQQVRRAFIAPAGHILLAADYSQVELRVLAHLSGDEAMKKAFERGEDIHASTATKLYHIPLDDVTREQRRIAKAVNFGLLYGMTAFRLARDTELSYKQAEALLNNYFDSYPSIKEYLDGIVSQAIGTGYVETIKKRRRYFEILQTLPDSSAGRAAQRVAKNHPIQGSAAEIIKIAMINIHKWLRQAGYCTRMVLQVHDELIFEVPEEELTQVAPTLIQIMSDAMPLTVPVIVDAKVGKNWAEMESWT
jgi:DNA polymerase-1